MPCCKSLSKDEICVGLFVNLKYSLIIRSGDTWRASLPLSQNTHVRHTVRPVVAASLKTAVLFRRLLNSVFRLKHDECLTFNFFMWCYVLILKSTPISIFISLLFSIVVFALHFL